MGLQARGLDALTRQLRAAGDDIGDLAAANTDVARYVAERSTPGMRRRTGRMAAATRGTGTDTAATITVDVPYAGPVIYGWRARNITPGPTSPDQVAVDTMDRWLNIYVDDIDDRVLSTIKGG